MQIGGLLDVAQAFDRGSGSDDPAYAQAWKRDFREAVDVDDNVAAVELLQRRYTFVTRVQPRVDVVFDDGNLVASGEFENFATRRQRHRCSSGILKVRSKHDELDAVGGERGFESFEVEA